MRKFLLLLVVGLLLSITTLGQSGFRASRYYQERYSISNKRIDWNTYHEFDNWGNAHYYERWQRVKWYSYRGTQTYYAWTWVNGQYRWVSHRSFGNYWYYKWRNYRRYFYYRNGRKFYKN